MITDRQRSEAVRICSEIQVTIAKISAQFTEAQQAADDFRQHLDAWRREHGLIPGDKNMDNPTLGQ